MKAKGFLLLLGGLLFGVMLGVAIVLGGPAISRSAEARRLPPTVGSAVPDFTLSQLDGTMLTLGDLKGRPVLINFWATWCPPCREEMPLLQSYADRYGDQLVVLGINYAEDAQTVAAYLDEQGIAFPIVLDEDGGVAQSYYVRSYPSTFFIDTDGILRAQHLGVLTEELMSIYLETVGIDQ